MPQSLIVAISQPGMCFRFIDVIDVQYDGTGSWVGTGESYCGGTISVVYADNGDGTATISLDIQANGCDVQMSTTDDELTGRTNTASCSTPFSHYFRFHFEPDDPFGVCCGNEDAEILEVQVTEPMQ